MSPQLTIQQLEHAITNIDKRVEAKKLEIHSYAEWRDHAPAAFGTLSFMLPPVASSEQESVFAAMSRSLAALREATVNLFTAKLNTALIDLEELELNLKAMRQMRSGVVGASMVPPFKQNQRH